MARPVGHVMRSGVSLAPLCSARLAAISIRRVAIVTDPPLSLRSQLHGQIRCNQLCANELHAGSPHQQYELKDPERDGDWG